MLKSYQSFNINCSHHCWVKYEVEEGAGPIYRSHCVSKNGGLEGGVVHCEAAMWLKRLVSHCQIWRWKALILKQRVWLTERLGYQPADQPAPQIQSIGFLRQLFSCLRYLLLIWNLKVLHKIPPLDLILSHLYSLPDLKLFSLTFILISFIYTCHN
jgi:hypothetical protein